MRLIPVGALIAIAYYGVQNFVEGEPTHLARLPGIAAIGVIVVLLVGAFELLYLPSRPGARLRRQPFAAQLLIRVIAMWLAIFIGLTLGNAFFNPAITFEYWRTPAIVIDAVVTFAIALVILFFLQMRDLVGPRILGAFVLGRYFRPVSEFRVFLFMDLANSTPLAERLGDEGTHALISQFFFDIAAPILEYEGETHRYIGDEIVVTWRESTAFRDNNCLEAIFAIDAEIARQKEHYIARFDEAPRFRAALHCGMVAAGECGEDKREIVFFGDTVNTTARIQSLCRELDRDILISDALAERLSPSDRYRLEALGQHQLRGRNQPIGLFAVHQTPRAPS